LVLTGDEQDYAIKTWRYLRLAMVLLVAGLGVSIAYERLKVDPGCFQTSISSYYYTPVHGFLIGALVSMGVCLICLRGNTDLEDVFLNLAGMLAPVVAFVPTPDRGDCSRTVVSPAERVLDIANNVTALLAVGLIALIAAAALSVRNPPAWPARVGYAVAVVLWVAATVVFWRARHFFEGNAHDIAAISMFVCILVVVAINALGFKEKTGAVSLRNRYFAVGVAMLVSVVAIPIVGAGGWDYWILLLEAVLIGLFAVFWVIQTVELWPVGLRTGQVAGSSAAIARRRGA
jgi:hypothetical protein